VSDLFCHVLCVYVLNLHHFPANYEEHIKIFNGARGTCLLNTHICTATNENLFPIRSGQLSSYLLLNIFCETRNSGIYINKHSIETDRVFFGREIKLNFKIEYYLIYPDKD
jgi:hypothetical protein